MRAKIATAWLLLLLCAAIAGGAFYAAHTCSQMLQADQFAAAARRGRLADLWVFPAVLFLWVIAGLLTPERRPILSPGPPRPRLPFMGRVAEFAACLLIFALPTITHDVHRSLAAASTHASARRQSGNLVLEALAARSGFDESGAWSRLLLGLSIDRDNPPAIEQLLNAPTIEQLLDMRSPQIPKDDLFARFKLAMWCREQGEEDLARRELNAILSRNPDDPSALRALGPGPNRPLRPSPPVELPAHAPPPGLKAPAGMVPVPDGKFPVRDGRESQSVRAFSIDRAEVTNAEYARFLIHVERQGNAEFRHPDQPPRKDHTPTHWGDPIFNAPGLPVVGVDWFDAYAFAKWAGKRLPLSLEWEAAGRGAEGRVFPWGDRWERWVANTPDRFLVYEFWGWPTAEWPVWVPSAAARDAFITVSATTPAGAFPRDRSPFGCLDMAGNVEEWVADWFKGVLAHEPMRTDIAEGAAPSDTEGLEARACGIRGGSWLHGGQKRPLSFLTAADPLSRTTARGFRCAK